MLLPNAADRISSHNLYLCIQEQAVEREHERDEFQQEIHRLEAQLRQTATVDNKGHRVRTINLIESLFINS